MEVLRTEPDMYLPVSVPCDVSAVVMGTGSWMWDERTCRMTLRHLL